MSKKNIFVWFTFCILHNMVSRLLDFFKWLLKFYLLLTFNFIQIILVQLQKQSKIIAKPAIVEIMYDLTIRYILFVTFLTIKHCFPFGVYPLIFFILIHLGLNLLWWLVFPCLFYILKRQGVTNGLKNICIVSLSFIFKQLFYITFSIFFAHIIFAPVKLSARFRKYEYLTLLKIN